MKFKELMGHLSSFTVYRYCSFCGKKTVDEKCKNPRCPYYVEDANEPKRTYKERIELLDNNILTEQELKLPLEEVNTLIETRINKQGGA